MTRLRLYTLPLVLLSLLTACGSEGEGQPQRASRSTTTTTSARLVASWDSPFETQLANGWVVRDCEGDRLNLCVHNGGNLLGDVELIPEYPLDSDDVGDDPQQVARKLARDMVTQFRADRAEGCAAFTFRPERVTNATIGSMPGARGGFALTDAKGRVVERVRNFYLVDGDKFAVVNVDAYVKEGGCLGPSEYDPSFEPADLERFEPYLDRLVADTPTSVTRS